MKQSYNNKYITYASIELSVNDVTNSIHILNDVLDGNIKVYYPLSISLDYKRLKISNRNEVIVLREMFDCLNSENKFQQFGNSVDCDVKNCYSGSYKHTESFEPPYGIFNSDVFYFGQ